MTDTRDPLTPPAGTRFVTELDAEVWRVAFNTPASTDGTATLHYTRRHPGDLPGDLDPDELARCVVDAFVEGSGYINQYGRRVPPSMVKMTRVVLEDPMQCRDCHAVFEASAVQHDTAPCCGGKPRRITQ